jgi:flagellar hook protein FlgE
VVANYLFGSSISAIQAQAKAFEVISHNIANSTTPGHKAETSRFEELVVDAGRVRGNVFPALRGTSNVVRRDIRAEGGVLATNGALDLALSGRGFFMVNTELDGSGTAMLTDSGQFQRRIVDNNGVEEVYLTDNVGNFVLGFPFDPVTETFTSVNDASGLVPIRLDAEGDSFQAVPTSEAFIDVNVPPDAATGEFFDAGLSIADGTGADDGIADRHNVTARFTKTATNNEWTLEFFGDNTVVTSPAAPVTVTFNADGTMNAPPSVALDLSFTDSGAAVSVTLDISDTRSFAPNFVIGETGSNGFEEGNLVSTRFNQSGVLEGVFSNGQSRSLAKLAIGDVVNPELLLPVTDTHFVLSGLNGDLQIFEADINGRAQIIPNSLEGSTVDLGEELVRMIETQRAYSSAATSLRTVEDLLETATNLKR